MNRLVLGTLIATQAAGCIISSSNSDAAHVVAGWTLEMSATHSVASCPPGYDTAALYSQEVDSTGTPLGDPVVDMFDCAAGAGTSEALAPALYKEWIEITTTDNSAVYARSSSSLEQDQVIDLTSSDVVYNTAVILDGGFFHFSWELDAASGGAQLTCAQAGATNGLELVATNVSSSSLSFTDVFHDCNDGEGLTDGIPTGDYTITINALNSQSATIGTAPTFTSTIAAPATLAPVTDLGNVKVPITGT